MKKLGIIVARFQVPSLHSGHMHLLEEAAKNCDVLLVILGHKVNQPDTKNPLSLAVRQAMVRQACTGISKKTHILLGDLEDSPLSNEAWSNNLDAYIQEHVRILESDTEETYEVCLYGSRDSFIQYYHGVYACYTVSEFPSLSGTKVREHIFSLQEDVLNDAQREGIVYAFKNIYAVGMSVVDILVYKREGEKLFLLLGRKKREISYRILGGFFDVALDRSLEDAALRELQEEAGDIQVKHMQYVMSKKVDDWRYRDNQHKIVSSLFMAEYVSGDIIASDDIVELMWCEADEYLFEKVIGSHREFVEKILDVLREKKEG